MLFVETNNHKEQLFLEEEFSREGNIFAVPLTKTQEIKTIIERILFEIFGQSNPTDKVQKPLDNCSQIVKKLANLIQNALSMKICLKNVRQVFEMIKQQQKKILLYQQYIISLNRQLMLDIEEDYEEMEQPEKMSQCRELEELFLEELKRCGKSVDILDADYIGFDSRAEITQQERIRREKKKNSLAALQYQYQYSFATDVTVSPANALRNQAPQTPKFSHGLHLDNLNDVKMNSSFEYSNENNDQQAENVINSKQSFEDDQNRENPSLIYCPPWKKLEVDQKQLLSTLFSTEESENKKKDPDLSTSSDYANLSGRIHPTPSFLNEGSLKQMIVKEKHEEIRKSNILRQSLIKPWIEVSSPKTQRYSEKIRQIKYQNKIRKNSKIQSNLKRDSVNEVKSNQKKQLRKSLSSFVPSLPSPTNKMNKLFKIKEKMDQSFEVQQSIASKSSIQDVREVQNFKFKNTFS